MEDDKFTIQEQDKGGIHQLAMKGAIDEDTNFSGLLSGTGPIHLNLAGIESINSLGIRAWVNFFKTATNRAVFYWECPPLIVRQMNMIPSFSGHAQVQSVFAPYICDHCEAEELRLIECGKPDWNRDSVQESFPCTQCVEGEMELDGNLNQYFSFKR
jgi:hypothetical protein